MKANKLIGSLICGWSTSFAVGQDSASIKGYKQPTCEEMRDALKQRAGGRHVNRPDPSNPNNLRGVWVWEEDEVGGKSSKEIDEASCEQIAGLYAKEFEGFQSGVVDEYGWPRLLKETIASSAKKSPQVSLGGPSLAAPGLKPDLKTGEYPQPIDPNNLTNEQKLDGAKSAFGKGDLPGMPPLFSGQAFDAAMQAIADALAAGKSYDVALQAGVNAGYKASHNGELSPKSSGNSAHTLVYKGNVGPLMMGGGHAASGGGYSTILGIHAGVQFPELSFSEDGFKIATGGIKGLIEAEVFSGQDGFGASLGPIGFSARIGYVHSFSAKGEVHGYAGPGGSLEWTTDGGVRSGYGAGIGAGASVEAGVGFSPLKSSNYSDWLSTGRAPLIMQPRWPARSRVQTADRMTAPSSNSGSSSWPESARPGATVEEKK